jgi:hypothetical protein
MSFTVIKTSEIQYNDSELFNTELTGYIIKYYSILLNNEKLYIGYGNTIEESIEDAKRVAGIK